MAEALRYQAKRDGRNKVQMTGSTRELSAVSSPENGSAQP